MHFFPVKKYTQILLLTEIVVVYYENFMECKYAKDKLKSFIFMDLCIVTLYYTRFNKIQQYAGIYLLQNHSLHVSGVHRTHHQEYIKL